MVDEHSRERDSSSAATRRIRPVTGLEGEGAAGSSAASRTLTQPAEPERREHDVTSAQVLTA